MKAGRRWGKKEENWEEGKGKGEVEEEEDEGWGYDKNWKGSEAR